jgi:hypothetical protein
MKKNSRGLSTIVATLLIILLTLVAVGVIWVVVRNVIQQGAEQVSLGKFTLNLEIENVIIDPAVPNYFSVRIKRNAGEGEISGLKFIVDDGDTTEVVEWNNHSLNELEERTINLTLTSILNASNIQKVSVAPIFKLESGKEVTGDVKDEYTIVNSSSSVTSGTTCSGSSTQSCSITNGVGNQTRTCNSGTWSAWSTCTVVSCNSGYMQSGNTCVASTCSGSNFQSCTITNGVGNQTRTCNSGTWGAPYGTCTVVSCNSGYVQSGNTCVASVPAWQTGMVSWWRFNGNANDYYGRNNGIVSGATLTSTNCKSGQCYSFDGSNDYINVSNSNTLDFPVSGTVSLWFNSNSSVGSWDMPLYRGGDPVTVAGYDFELGAGQWITDISNGTSSIERGCSYSDSPLIGLHMLTFTFDTTTNYLLCYVDGTNTDSSYMPGFGGIDSSQNMYIGSDAGSLYNVNGSIDEVMVFNRSLSATEIQQIYNYSYP